jgi:uncharacterized membrane protein
VLHSGPSAVLAAFDVHGLVQLARRGGSMLVLVPEVGDFVATGEPLFEVHGRGDMDAGATRSAVVLGPERTFEQDPAFCFRVLVEIAAKALSPGINDPSTTVLAIDQLNRLLRRAARKNLDTGYVRDERGAPRLLYRTPDWEDFVSLAVAEIRIFEAGSIQIARRLRAMLESVLFVAPTERAPPLLPELDLLRRSVERSFPDEEDCLLASVADFQGVGGSNGEFKRA